MKHKHLTLSDRIEIELGITQGSSFRKIASIIEKDPSTVSKEIKKHLVVKQLDKHEKLSPCECSHRIVVTIALLSVINVDIVNNFTTLSMRNDNMRLNYLILVKVLCLIRRVFIK